MPVQQNRRSRSTYDATGRPRQALAGHVEPVTPIIPNGKPPHERKELKQALLVNPSSNQEDTAQPYINQTPREQHYEYNKISEKALRQPTGAAGTATNTAVRDLVAQPARKQQVKECQSTQLSMSPTISTGPLTHLSETQNKARPGSEHPTRHWGRRPRRTGRPDATRTPSQHPHSTCAQTAKQRQIRIIGRSKQDREDHLTQKRRHGPAPTARSRRHVNRPGSPPLETQSSPAPPWRKHPQPMETHP